VQGGISVLKAVDLYLRKFRLKAELIKLIWAKRPRSQWIYTNTVHLYLSTVQRDPIRITKVRYMYIVLL
jgi:hypothetical protein